MPVLTQVRDRILRQAIRRQPRATVSSSRLFSSLREATAFMEAEVDRPVTRRACQAGAGVRLRIFPRTLSNGGFTNVYDVSWEPDAATAGIHICARPADIRVMGQACGALYLAQLREHGVYLSAGCLSLSGHKLVMMTGLGVPMGAKRAARPAPWPRRSSGPASPARCTTAWLVTSP